MTHHLIISTFKAEIDGLEHRLIKFLFSRPPEFGWDQDIKYTIQSGQKTQCLDGILLDGLPFSGDLMVAGSMVIIESLTLDKTMAEALVERREHA